MKRTALFIGLMFVITVVFVYGQDNVNTQSIVVQPDKIFDEPLEKRVQEAVSGMESYGEEIQKEIEPIKDNREKQQKFATKMGEYLLHYVRSNSTRELLALETQILKKGEGPESIYGWFHAIVHGAVLNLAGYSPIDTNPINKTLLDIVQDNSVDDYVRSKYVVDIGSKFNSLHNKRIKVDEEIREKVYPVLIKIIDDTSNDSRLRAEAAGTLASIGKDNEKIALYVLRLSDDKDDLVKERTIKSFYRLNDDIRKKLILILKDRQHYSKNIVMAARKRLLSEVNKSEEGMPYIIDMLNETEDKEEFKRIALDLQKYDNVSTMEPIIRKFKELKLGQPHESYYYLNNELLLDYLPQASKEDRFLIIRLIYETAHQTGGNVEIPHHYDKAITVMGEVLNDESKDNRLLALNAYESMTSAIKHETLDSVEKDKEKLLKEIETILSEHKKHEKDEFLLEVTDLMLKEIKNNKNDQTIDQTN